MRSNGDEQVRRPSGAMVIVGITVALAWAQPTSAAEEPMRGVVRAANQASLSTDLPMRLTRLPYREGHAFRAGEVIAEFDCRRSMAERQATEAALREAQLNLDANLKLEGYKAVGRHEIEVSRARLEKAKGEKGIIEARLEDCVVRAPFAGRVSEAPLRVLESTVAQRPYLSIVEDGSFEIEFILSSSLLSGLKVGQEFAYRIDEVPDAIGRATVSAVNPTVDPVSKTGKFTARVLSAPHSLTVGMSCTGDLATGER